MLIEVAAGIEYKHAIRKSTVITTKSYIKRFNHVFIVRLALLALYCNC